jgi:hypothetical protein
MDVVRYAAAIALEGMSWLLELVGDRLSLAAGELMRAAIYTAPDSTAHDKREADRIVAHMRSESRG